MNYTKIWTILFLYVSITVSAYELGSYDTYTIQSNGSGNYRLIDKRYTTDRVNVHISQVNARVRVFKIEAQGSIHNFNDVKVLENILGTIYPEQSVPGEVINWFAQEIYRDITGPQKAAAKKKSPRRSDS